MTLQDRYPIAFQLYPYKRAADQDAETPATHPVVVVGAGPVGLTTALDLGLKGHPVLVLDDHEGVGEGSRAICFSKRTLEIAHRLGAASDMFEKGVVWKKGRVFHDRTEIYEFDLLPEDGHRYPAFINLSQIHFEKFLVQAIERANKNGACIELRGKNRVDKIKAGPTETTLDISTPEGAYSIIANWVVACDGARSPIRDLMGLGFDGRVFEDNFLIADVKVKADFPTERWFWFEPWFKSGSSALLHKQPDDIWRIDFQLGWDIDRQKELKEKNVRARVDQMLGGNVEYDLDWCSIYTFQCCRMDKFRIGRVVFVGDSAHQVSPFGARGANSGIQDAENLAWKLDLILKDVAPDTLIDTYDAERAMAADENILNSTRSTDFLTPKTDGSKIFRNAVLKLAAQYPFARPLVNSGRLSVPCVYDGLNGFGPDELGLPIRTRPGAPMTDAPFLKGYLLDHIFGDFTVLGIGIAVPPKQTIAGIPVVGISINDISADIRDRYLGDAPKAVYLIRPDQHIVARWNSFDANQVSSAVCQAIGKGESWN